MNRWKDLLRKNLSGFKRLAIMCVGSEDSGDDAAGIEVAARLFGLVEKENLRNVIVINCFNMPENFTSIVKKAEPTSILIIDTCITGKKPGSITIFLKDQLKETDMMTHRIPLKLLSEYLASETKASIVIAGIEPETIKKGYKISKSVLGAIEIFTDFLSGFIKNEQKGKIFRTRKEDA